MKYFVITDIHAFYTLTRKALEESGFFDEKEKSKLIICGDILDRGKEVFETQAFILELMKENRVILIRGNHEDLLEKMLDELLYGDLYLFEMGTSHYIKNGTWQTALTLSGLREDYALAHTKELVAKVKSSDFYRKILPDMVDYYETDNYIFTHGYIPVTADDGNTVYRTYKSYRFNENWREASVIDWQNARWYNGMEFVCKRRLGVKDKTVVCGHWSCSYGHAEVDHKCSELGKNAIFDPFYSQGIIALDARTAFSKRVNCIVIED